MSNKFCEFTHQFSFLTQDAKDKKKLRNYKNDLRSLSTKKKKV